MRTSKLLITLCAVVFAGGVVAEQGWAAMKIRKKETPSAPAQTGEPKTEPKKDAAPEKKASPVSIPKKKPKAISADVFAGKVIGVRGRKVLAEIPGGASPKERFILYDARLRRAGSVVVKRDMEDGIYLLRLSGGKATEDFRIARETEEEAYARVKKTKSVEGYIEFLEVYPDSKRRPAISRALFRHTLRETYQTFPGSTITGRVQLQEKVGTEISMARAMIKLDRFVIGMTDEVGEFRIEGIPPFNYPVKVKLTVRDEKFQMAADKYIEIPSGEVVDLASDLDVKLTPTFLVGKVVDENGNPVREAEVWTSPYTMEVLTDENGQYSISRTKKLDSSGAPLEGDEPLMGHDYEVYAYRKGFGAEKVMVQAESFVENEVKQIKLERGEAGRDDVPELDVDLRANLDLMQFVVPAGSGPKINQ